MGIKITHINFTTSTDATYEQQLKKGKVQKRPGRGQKSTQ